MSTIIPHKTSMRINKEDFYNATYALFKYLFKNEIYELKHPDELRENRNKKDIDITFKIANKQVAIEHTRVPFYDNEIEINKYWDAKVAPTIRNLIQTINSKIKLNGDCINLWIPNNIELKVSGKINHMDQIYNEIMDNYENLESDSKNHRNNYNFQLSKNGAYLHLTRFKYPARIDDRVNQIAVYRYTNYSEFSSFDKIKETILNNKVSKLEKYKNSKYFTVLLLQKHSAIVTGNIPLFNFLETMKYDNLFNKTIDMVVSCTSYENENNINIMYFETSNYCHHHDILRNNTYNYYPLEDRIIKCNYI